MTPNTNQICRTIYDHWAMGNKYVVLDGFVYRICNTLTVGEGMFLLISKGCRARTRRRMRVYAYTHATAVFPNKGWWNLYRFMETKHYGAAPPGECNDNGSRLSRPDDGEEAC